MLSPILRRDPHNLVIPTQLEISILSTLPVLQDRQQRVALTSHITTSQPHPTILPSHISGLTEPPRRRLASSTARLDT